MAFNPPDWREDSKYPTHIENSSLSYWAWQFLRRNKEYQQEWARYVELQYQIAKKVPELLILVRLECDFEYSSSEEAKDFRKKNRELLNKLHGLHMSQFENWHYSPPKIPEDITYEAYASRMRNSDVDSYRGRPLAQFLGEKWGIDNLVNPAIEKPGLNVSFLLNGSAYQITFESNKYANDRNYVTPLFDLRYPVDVLRAQFEWMLEHRKRKIDNGEIKPYGGRPERAIQHYRQYLRVIDAVDIGMKIPEVAEVLLPNYETENAKKTVRNWLNAAEKLRGGDYKFLPAYSECHIKKR